MKRLSIVLLLTGFLISSCNKLDIEKGTPKCVENKIEKLNKSSTCQDANVEEYTFQKNTVYTLDPGTCGAGAIEVINSDCNSLGYLGGVTGNREINGEQFSNAIFIKTIWKKQ